MISVYDYQAIGSSSVIFMFHMVIVLYFVAIKYRWICTFLILSESPPLKPCVIYIVAIEKCQNRWKLVRLFIKYLTNMTVSLCFVVIYDLSTFSCMPIIVSICIVCVCVFKTNIFLCIISSFFDLFIYVTT